MLEPCARLEPMTDSEDNASTSHPSLCFSTRITSQRVKRRKLGNDVCTVILSYLYESNLDVLLFAGLLEEHRLFSSLLRKQLRSVLCTTNRKMNILRIIFRFIFLCTHLNFQLLLHLLWIILLLIQIRDKDMKRGLASLVSSFVTTSW
jgi:hypothetical protein